MYAKPLMFCIFVTKLLAGTGYHMSRSCACISVSSVFWSGMISKSISFNFGAPRKYSGLATITTRWLRCHSLYLNGPIPIGSESYGTLLKFGYFARMCLGNRHGFAPAEEKNVSTNGEYGLFRCTTTVYLSGSSTFAM